MGAGDAAMFLGALAATWILSRIIQWLLRRMGDGAATILASHALSGLIAVVASAAGESQAGEWNWSYALYYVVAQIAWLGFDLIRHRRSEVSG